MPDVCKSALLEPKSHIKCTIQQIIFKELYYYNFFFCLPDNDTNINSKKDISKFILSSFSFVSFVDILTSI